MFCEEGVNQTSRAQRSEHVLAWFDSARAVIKTTVDAADTPTVDHTVKDGPYEGN